MQPGSAKSLCMVGSTLYYKADHGVMAYDGSVPESVSAALGGVYYQNAVAGTERGRLYLSMQDAAESWHLFVYDTETGIWCREDATHAAAFATLNGNAYMLDANGTVWKNQPGGRRGNRGAGALDGRNRDAGPVCAGRALHQPAANPAVAAGGKPVCGVGAV